MSAPNAYLYTIRLENGDIATVIARDSGAALDYARRFYDSPPDYIEGYEDYVVGETSVPDEPSIIDTSEKVAIKFKGAKYDSCKYNPGLVKIEPLVRAISAAREYGLNKYQEAEDWQSIEPQRWRDALVRHVLAENDDPGGYDEESGLPRICHIAANVMFLLNSYQL